jgi:long-subunit fatty acid transport protein
MRKRLSAALVFVFLLLPASQAFAVAEAGVPSLIIPPGARPNGMGESFVAISDDATASWWNPAGLAFLPRRNIALMHSQLVPDLASDVYYEFIGYTNEIRNVGTLSFSLVYLTYGTSVATNVEGEVQGEFKSWEATGTVSFAMPIRKTLGLGLSMKFIHADYAPDDFTLERLDGTGSSFAVDAGVLWKLPNQKLNFGLSLTNVGPDIAFIDQEQSDPLPITLRGGVAFYPIQDEISDLLITFDLEQSLVWLIDDSSNQRRSEIYHIGAEYKYVDLLAGRIGYVYDEDGDFKAPTYGLGFIYKKKLSLDYANVPQAQTLDRVHRWSIYFMF